MTPVTLSDEHLELAFDPVTGGMTRFLLKATGWQVVNNPALQAGLRLLVRTPEHGCNTAHSANQTLSAASFDDQDLPATNTLTIPARSVAVLVEN